MVRRRHRAEVDEVRLRAAQRRAAPSAAMRLVGSGNPPLHRFRVGLDFAISGHREVDGDDRPARRARPRRWPSSSACRTPCRRPSARRTSVGTATAGRAGSRATRSRSRRGSRSSRSSSRSRTASAGSTAARRSRGSGRDAVRSRPRRRCCASTPTRSSATSTRHARGTRSSAPSRRSACALSGDEFDAALRRGRRLRRPEVAVHARPRARGRGARRPRRRRHSGSATTRSSTLRRAGLVHGLGRLGVSNAIWDKPGPLGAGEWERVRLQPYLTERMLHQSADARADRRRRRAAPRTPRRLGLPARPAGPRDLAGRRGCSRPPTRTSRCASRDRTARRSRPTTPPPSCGAEVRGRPARRRRGRGGARRGGPSRRTATRRPGRAHRPRGRGAAAASHAACRTRRSRTRLVISPKTARNHIEHIYAKIGASSRVAASLFAMQHGLLPERRPRGFLTFAKMGQSPHEASGAPSLRWRHEPSHNDSLQRPTTDRRPRLKRPGSAPCASSCSPTRRGSARDWGGTGANLPHYGPQSSP